MGERPEPCRSGLRENSPIVVSSFMSGLWFQCQAPDCRAHPPPRPRFDEPCRTLFPCEFAQHVGQANIGQMAKLRQRLIDVGQRSSGALGRRREHIVKQVRCGWRNDRPWHGPIWG